MPELFAAVCPIAIRILLRTVNLNVAALPLQIGVIIGQIEATPVRSGFPDDIRSFCCDIEICRAITVDIAALDRHGIASHPCAGRRSARILQGIPAACAVRADDQIFLAGCDTADQFVGRDARRGRRCNSHHTGRGQAAIHSRCCDRCGAFRDARHLAVLVNSRDIGVAGGPGNLLICSLRGNCRRQLHDLARFHRCGFGSDCNTRGRHRITCLADRDGVRIVMRADRKQVRRTLLISKVLVTGGIRGCVAALQQAAVHGPAVKRIAVIQYPDVRCVSQHQMSMTGIIAGIIVPVQIPPTQVSDIVATCRLFNDPADAVIRGIPICISDTGQPGIRIAGTAALGGVRRYFRAQRVAVD